MQIRGIDAAEKFLKARGYEILERNYQCFAGTMDLIAQYGDALVFIDVMSRESGAQGFPSEKVTEETRSRAEKIALEYLTNSDFANMRIRFDTVAIVELGGDRAMVCHHVNAFSAA